MNDIEVYSGISAMEAEQAVLGAMLVDARSVPEVMEGVKVDDFRPGPNQDIYRAIHAMFLAGEPIDPVTVLENMRRSGYYDENQSRAYMLQLMDATPTAANVGEYIKILRDRSLQRQVASIINDLGGMIKEGLTSGRDLLEELEKRASNIRLGRSQSGLVPVSEVLLEAYDCLEETAVNGKSSSTVSTGLPDLDRRINGLRGGNLIVLAARPGMGKTSMALNMALEAGKFSGKEVAFFSLEVGRLELAYKLVSAEVYLEHSKLVSGHMTDDDWAKMSVAAEALNEARILIDDNSANTVASIKAECRRRPNLGLVIIDYLQLMQSAGGKSGSRGENRQQIVADISRSLKIMAKELNVPVVCLSQLNRSNESRMDKRPMLSDLRESGAIEQDADVVLFLHREGYYDKEAEDANLAECIVAKNRHGATGTVELTWLPEYTTFASLERRYDEAS
jgi:replicative DNA helicase|nr:replicative DNA helicase [Acutalibacter muris]